MSGGVADPLARAAELRRSGARFALATVVRSEPPASARPGDRAIVLEDGALEGWVGGSCAQPVVQREALRALAEGAPRLIRLSAEPDAWGRQEAGVASYPMTCHSGGTLEIFVEPFVPLPRLVVLGQSPVAAALAALAGPLGFAVDAALPAPAEPLVDTWIVVAAMGSDDELVVEQALACGVPYVALVASQRRAATIRDYLGHRGLAAEAVARLKAPAGLDLGAATGPEIALSILAEIVQQRRAAGRTPSAPPLDPLDAQARRAASAPPAAVAGPEATDPVCGMQVAVAAARWTSLLAGQTVYFCAPGCKRRFDRDPAAYAATPAPEPSPRPAPERGTPPREAPPAWP